MIAWARLPTDSYTLLYVYRSPRFTHFLFYRQLHFSFQPGVANGISEKQPQSCYEFAYILTDFCSILSELAFLRENRLYFPQFEAAQLLRNCLFFGQISG